MSTILCNCSLLSHTSFTSTFNQYLFSWEQNCYADGDRLCLWIGDQRDFTLLRTASAKRFTRVRSKVNSEQKKANECHFESKPLVRGPSLCTNVNLNCWTNYIYLFVLDAKVHEEPNSCFKTIDYADSVQCRRRSRWTKGSRSEYQFFL